MDQPNYDKESVLGRAMERFKQEQDTYYQERDLLEEMQDDHQTKWRMLMRKVGRQ